MIRNPIIEFYEFSPIEGISEEALLKAINKMFMRFFKKQRGFIKGEVLRIDDNWVSIAYWNDLEEAKVAAENFLNHSSRLPFIQMISPSSERRIYLKRMLSYKGS